MLDSGTTSILQKAVAAARAGDLRGAHQFASDGLTQGGDVIAINAFLGMLQARSGDSIGAVYHLREAHRGRPDDATIACNLISILIDTGDLAGAFVVATQAMALADPSLRVARYRGFLAQSLERYDDAVAAYDHVVKHEPRDFESWNNLGNARTGAGDLSGSVTALRRAVTLEPMAPPTRLNLAAALVADGQVDEAESILRQAARDFPADAQALHELSLLLKEQGRDEDAVQSLEQAVARDPKHAGYHLKLGVEYGAAVRLKEAEQAFLKAISLDPLLVDAYLGLAIQYEHSNREEEFAPLITRAETNGVDLGTLGFLQALEHRRAGRFDDGLLSLSFVPATMEPERTAHIRATLLDRLGRTDEAFAAFKETNVLHAGSATDPLRRAAEMRGDIRSGLQTMTPAWVSKWPVAAPTSERPDPVFLVGFPRSGTTLLDTILMGHSGAIVMEEQPPLNIVDQEIGGLGGITSLDEAAIIAARARYFEEVEKVQPLDRTGLLIDKSPLYLNKVPLIQRLFPKAKFILTLRHPCDVLLSCFMSNFRLNAAMSNFLRIEDAADFYDLTFQHWQQSCTLFSMNVHTIVYEQLIEDVEAEVRPLFEFLGLEWRDEVLDHQRTAKSRGLITTASYAQVTEPIYKRAAGRWERYRTHLEPVFPTLAPWVEKFGYTF